MNCSRFLRTIISISSIHLSAFYDFCCPKAANDSSNGVVTAGQLVEPPVVEDVRPEPVVKPKQINPVPVPRQNEIEPAPESDSEEDTSQAQQPDPVQEAVIEDPEQTPASPAQSPAIELRYENYQICNLGSANDNCLSDLVLDRLPEKTDYQRFIAQAKENDLAIVSEEGKSFLGVVRGGVLLPISDLGILIIETPLDLVLCLRYLRKLIVPNIETTNDIDKASAYFNKLTASIGNVGSFLDQYNFVRINLESFKPYALVLEKNNIVYGNDPKKEKFRYFIAHNGFKDVTIVFARNDTRFLLIRDDQEVVKMVSDLGDFRKIMTLTDDSNCDDISIPPSQIRTTENPDEAKEYFNRLYQTILGEATLRYADISGKSLVVMRNNDGAFMDTGIFEDRVDHLVLVRTLYLANRPNVIDCYKVFNMPGTSWVISARGELAFDKCKTLQGLGVAELSPDAEYCKVNLKDLASLDLAHMSFAKLDLHRSDVILLKDSLAPALCLGNGFIQYLDHNSDPSKTPVPYQRPVAEFRETNYKFVQPPMNPILFANIMYKGEIEIASGTSGIYASKFKERQNNALGIAFNRANINQKAIVTLNKQDGRPDSEGKIMFVSDLGFHAPELPLTQDEFNRNLYIPILLKNIKTTDNFQEACNYYQHLKQLYDAGGHE